MAKFKRILLKLSGESLMGEQGYGIDVKRLNEYAAQIKEALEMGVQISIVIGGEEAEKGTAVLKNMRTGETAEINLDNTEEIAKTVTEDR